MSASNDALLNGHETVVFSIGSNRRLAKVCVADIEAIKRPGGRSQFRVVKGFGALWQQSFENKSVAIQDGDTTYIIRLLAFPAERTGVGFLEFDSVLHQPLEVTAPEPQPVAKRRKRQQNSRSGGVMGRLRRLFQGN